MCFVLLYRSTSACVSPLADCEAGMCIKQKLSEKKNIYEHQLKVFFQICVNLLCMSSRGIHHHVFSVSSVQTCSIADLNLFNAAINTQCPQTDGNSGRMNCSIPAGPSGDCIPLKRIKTEPPDGEIIQVTVPGKWAHAKQPLALKLLTS